MHTTNYKLFNTTLGMIMFLLFSFSLHGQKAKNWGIESNLFIGKITAHTPAILLDVDHLSQGLDLNFKYQTFGKEKWHQYQDYPDLGISLVYFNLGDKDILGHSIGIMPNLTIDILQRPRGYIQYQFGWGLAYLSKHYNQVTNPTNNTVGSHWNNIVTSRFDGGVIINPQWSAQLGIGIVHYSNGASQLPNFGTNIIAGNVGVKYTPHPVSRKDYIWYDDFLNVPEKRWGAQIHFDLAYQEITEIGGPRYPIYIGSFAGTYHFNAVNRLIFGVEIEYNTSVFHHLNQVTVNYDKDYSRNQSTRYMYFVADEFMFGNFGLMMQAGFYFKKKERVPKGIYNKLSVRYYLPPIGKPATQFYAAVYLKSHLSVAEYLAFGIGANL